MTREEAIKWLKTFKGHTGMAELSQAFDVAIKALEQEPCEDTISRAEVHDLLATWLSDKLDEKTREVLEVIDGKVEDMSSVTQKQRTGHWIDVKPYGGCECSLCGCLEAGYSDFCPDCGAKMVEPQESEVSDADSD